MTEEGAGRPSSGGYSPDGMNAVPGRSAGQDEAIRRLLVALDQCGREVAIAADTIDLCEDFEGCAYHLRRALAHLKFAGGTLVDLRKRAGTE